jgi:hypothetical protein
MAFFCEPLLKAFVGTIDAQLVLTKSTHAVAHMHAPMHASECVFACLLWPLCVPGACNLEPKVASRCRCGSLPWHCCKCKRGSRRRQRG